MKDGGPAFPQEDVPLSAEAKRFGFKHVHVQGMTMRQFYKAAALNGILSDSSQILEGADPDILADAAAEFADAMLAEDEERKRGGIEGQGEANAGREGDSHHAVVSGERPPLAGRADHAHG